MADKPVVCIKIGRTEAGTAMAGSHTGHLTGSDAVIDGLFAQHAVIRVDDMDQLIDTAALFAKVSAGNGPRAAIYGMSGGATTLMAELAQQYGVPIPALSSATIAELAGLLPTYLHVSNPVDNGMQFVMAAPAEQRQRVLDLMADDPNIDVIMTSVNDAESPFTATFIDDLITFRQRHPVPVLCAWATPRTDSVAMRALVDAGIPVFRSAGACMQAWQRFCAYQTKRGSFRDRPTSDRSESAHVERILSGPVQVLGSDDTNALLAEFGVPISRGVVVSDRDQAGKTAEMVGLPVAMKISSPDFPHKSDAGLVRLNVDSEAAALIVYDELVARAHEVDATAEIEGVLIQRQLSGTELIVGVTLDPTLGPAVLVGFGGIFTEVMSDSAVRPLPLDRADVEEMLRSLRGFPILAGARGRPAADLEQIIDFVESVALLAGACGGRLRELDLNPVLVTADAVIAVDALVIAGTSSESQS